TFLQEGYSVSILIRPNAKLAIDLPQAVNIFYGNIDNLQDVLHAIEGHQYVIHAASITEQFNIKADNYERINVTATKHIVNACQVHSIKKLIYVSTANTIAPGSKSNPGTELNGF